MVESGFGKHACCDAGKESYAFKVYDKCGDFWYRCGFGKKRQTLNETVQGHKRLEHYKLIRLSEGSRIVLLAATEHGRQCTPRKWSDGPCP